MKDVSSGLRAGLAMAVCAALLAPAATADNGKNPQGEHPGNSATAPGQEKKEEPAAAPEPAPAAPSPPDATPPAPPPPPPPPPPPAPAQAPEPAQASEPTTPPASTQPTARPEPSGRPHGSEKPPRPNAPTPPAPASASGPPRDSTAHDKVLICHATGSARNPYVVISISVNAWSRGSGHGAHPDDVFIDWSWPGDPRQKDERLCPSTESETPTPTAGETTPTPAALTSVAAATDSLPATTQAPAAVAVASSAPAADPRSGSADPASWSTSVHPSGHAGGVLATTSRLGRAAVVGTLPFTGVPLWATVGVAIVLIAGGLAVRRRARPRRAVPSA